MEQLTDATGTLTVTVTAVNDTPVASAQSVTTIEDISIEISLSGSDIDGDTLTYQVVTSPLNGTVTLTGDKATYILVKDTLDLIVLHIKQMMEL